MGHIIYFSSQNWAFPFLEFVEAWRAMGKEVFGLYTDNEDPDQPVGLQSDQCFRCPFTKLQTLQT